MPRAVNQTKPYAKLQTRPSGTAMAAATTKSRVRHCQSTPLLPDTGRNEPSPVAIPLPPSLEYRILGRHSSAGANRRKRHPNQERSRSGLDVVPLPYARFNEIRFEELVVLIPPLSYSLPRGDDLCGCNHSILAPPNVKPRC